ncbi:MAG: response regulator transcription factor [Opitutales bacterium]
MESTYSPSTDKPSLLIAEDDLDLRDVIVTDISDRFEILEASNGKEGIRLANEHVPDIIVSDIMMPMVDGVEFCREIKGNPATSHVPFVMLTAKNTVENQIEGLKTGADHYLTKPFHPDLLIACVENLLQTRQLLREKVSRELSLEGLTISGPDVDREFFRKAVQIIEDNISDTEFNAETFAKTLGMSLRSLQRKMKVLANSSPSKFITEVRLRHAEKLIVNTSLSITEISLRIACDHSSNFSQMFKNQFGQTPTEYRASNR